MTEEGAWNDREGARNDNQATRHDKERFYPLFTWKRVQPSVKKPTICRAAAKPALRLAKSEAKRS